MIEAAEFIGAAEARARSFYSGVPCSFLTPLLNGVISGQGTDYVGATSEGEAVAIASGAWLAGRDAVMMCQNSGLGNAVNPLTSLNWPFKIPILLVVTHRGAPGLGDEPQHELMGQITGDILDVMRVEWATFPEAAEDIAGAMDRAEQTMRDTQLPFALVLPKGRIASAKLHEPPIEQKPSVEIIGEFGVDVAPRRIDVMERLCALAPDDAGIIATTGFCGRELFELGDAPRNLYVVGSMGCASALGLGAAMNSDRPIIILDGDGAALMKLGNMATIGQRGPGNLVHVLLDNGRHESTGGQQTVSAGIDFCAVAQASGYDFVARANTVSNAEAVFDAALRASGPSFIHCRVSPSAVKNLARPDIAPSDVARRFRDFLNGAS